jgi:hypothetical protein
MEDEIAHCLCVIGPYHSAAGQELKLIGHGHFHGLMHGEAFNLQTIVFREMILV